MQSRARCCTLEASTPAYSDWGGFECEGWRLFDFLKELTRRKVWLFGGIYLALGWVLLQVAVVVESTLSLPGWVDQIALVLLALGFPVALLLAWAQESQRADGSKPDGKASAAAMVAQSIAKPDGFAPPSFSVAVLPFDDLSRDGIFQEVADGVPEDILTRLSQYPSIIVAARNSSFAFKGTSPDIRDVGAKLNMRFVLEGSFRKVGDNVRVTAQLIDATSGTHVWSESFDRLMDQMDNEMDRIVDATVMGSLVAIQDAETRRFKTMQRSQLTALDLTVLAYNKLNPTNLPGLREALELVEEALEKDPDHIHARAAAASIEARLPIYGSGDRRQHWQRAAQHLERTQGKMTVEPGVMNSLANAARFMGRQQDLEMYAEQMREQHPWFAGTWAQTAIANERAGRYSQALEAIERGSQLFNSPTQSRLFLVDIAASVHLGLGELDLALDCTRHALHIGDSEPSRRLLTVILALQGKFEEAAAELENLKAFWGGTLSLTRAERLLRSLTEDQAMIDLQLEGLRLAGLEEEGADA